MKEAKTIIKLEKRDLKVIGFTSNDDARPVLQYVQVRRHTGGHTELVATNSYIAVKHTVPTSLPDSFESFIVPAVVFKRALALMGRGNESHAILLTNNSVHIPELNVRFSWPKTNFAYPDVDKAIKNIQPSADSVVVNPHYVKLVAAWFNDFLDYGSMSLSVNAFPGPVEFKNDRTYAVIMPLKV